MGLSGVGEGFGKPECIHDNQTEPKSSSIPECHGNLNEFRQLVVFCTGLCGAGRHDLPTATALRHSRGVGECGGALMIAPYQCSALH